MKNINLKIVLFKKGVTQRELSKKTGIPEAQVSMAILGKYNLDKEQCLKISEVLESNHNELFPQMENN